MQNSIKKLWQLASFTLVSALSVILLMGSSAWVSTANAQLDGTFLSFTSQSGDYIGQGQSQIFTPSGSQFSSMVSQDGREIAVSYFPEASGTCLAAPVATSYCLASMRPPPVGRFRCRPYQD
jgi:hypothetical protein